MHVCYSNRVFAELYWPGGLSFSHDILIPEMESVREGESHLNKTMHDLETSLLIQNAQLSGMILGAACTGESSS